MSDEGLTLEDLKAAMHEGRAIVAHFVEIRDRVFELLKRLREDRERGERPSGDAEETRTLDGLTTDAAALVGYLQLMLDENERLVAYLLGLEEAGTISRAELEFLMGLRKGTASASAFSAPPADERVIPIKILGHWHDARVHTRRNDLFIDIPAELIENVEADNPGVGIKRGYQLQIEQFRIADLFQREDDRG